MTDGLLASAYIPGRPRPQGSKNAAVKNGRVVMWEASKGLVSWRSTVVAELVRLNPHGLTLVQPWDRAATLIVEFVFEKPKSNKNEYPVGKPDLDKLVRAVCDALVEAGYVRDDSQIVHLMALKSWAAPNGQSGAYVSLYKYNPISERDLRANDYERI